MNEIAEQMATLEEPCPRATRQHYDILTPRVREVALLVERNLSNAEIASNLGIKRGTVKMHVHTIFSKCGLSPRPRRGRWSKSTTTAAGLERIREAQRRRWQRWRAARSADNA